MPPAASAKAVRSVERSLAALMTDALSCEADLVVTRKRRWLWCIGGGSWNLVRNVGACIAFVEGLV